MSSSQITFFQRFEADILAGKKTITIRDESESDYSVGSIVQVSTLEQQRPFCQIKITGVEPTPFQALNEYHAQQENMPLAVLKSLIQEIYPGIERLFVITFKLHR
jgi:uncharacterized protein YqfB (UPF0267 family)